MTLEKLLIGYERKKVGGGMARKKEAAEVGNLITQKLYNMVYKLAPLLVGVETQKQAKDILESEVEIVLEELNRMSNEL